MVKYNRGLDCRHERGFGLASLTQKRGVKQKGACMINTKEGYLGEKKI